MTTGRVDSRCVSWKKMAASPTWENFVLSILFPLHFSGHFVLLRSRSQSRSMNPSKELLLRVLVPENRTFVTQPKGWRNDLSRGRDQFGQSFVLGRRFWTQLVPAPFLGPFLGSRRSRWQMVRVHEVLLEDPSVRKRDPSKVTVVELDQNFSARIDERH